MQMMFHFCSTIRLLRGCGTCFIPKRCPIPGITKRAIFGEPILSTFSDLKNQWIIGRRFSQTILINLSSQIMKQTQLQRWKAA